MGFGRIVLRSLTSLVVAALSLPTYATTQCPAEFGLKDPLVNVFGWLVVALGILAGGLLVAYVFRRSRKIRLPLRVAVVSLVLFGMIIIWGGSLALAMNFFFLRC